MASKVGTTAVDMVANAVDAVVYGSMMAEPVYGSDWMEWTLGEVNDAIRSTKPYPRSAKGLEAWLSKALLAAHATFTHMAPLVAGTAQEFADDVLTDLENDGLA